MKRTIRPHGTPLCSYWFLATLLVAAAVLSARSAPAARQRPNIVFILADDLGWADLGCYGNRFNETPNIDRLAGQGVRFTQFYAAGPVCSPTRASIQSGQYQARFGLTAHIPGHWRPFERLAEPPPALSLPHGLVTLPERLREAGYRTAHFGKWHLGGRGSGPKDHGFDEAFEFTGHTVPGPRQDPPTETPRRLADYLADRAVQFMEANRDRPFYLQLSHYSVHIPLNTTPELQAKYEAKPKVAGYPCHPLYAGVLEEMDTSAGRVMGALDQLGLAGNTLVIFTSDNGGLEREAGGWPGTSNDPLRNEKGSLYEGGTRIPLIVRWPGVTSRGTVANAPAVSVDFYPTLLHAAGVKAKKGQVLDGVDLGQALRQPGRGLTREAIYWHYPHYHHSRPSGAVRAGDWKAIEFFDTGEVELYNLKDDLSEGSNLAERMPEKVRAMHGMLQEWREAVNAQMPQPNPAHDPQRAGEWWSRARVERTEAPGTYRPMPKP
jgi:arylsulfatase A